MAICSRCDFEILEGESYQQGLKPGERMHSLDRCFDLTKGALANERHAHEVPSAKPEAAPPKAKKSKGEKTGKK